MRPRSGWSSVGDVEIAVAEYIDWFNHRPAARRDRPRPTVEFEETHWASACDQHYRQNPILNEAGST